MATAFSSSVSHGRKDSSTSLRRQLSNSTPLFKTISKDLCTGWLSPTSESSSSKHDTQSSHHHKPRHAARDALKTTSPQEWKGTLESPERDADTDTDTHTRHDSFVSAKPCDAGKLSHVGLVPDHSLDSWSSGWDVAYERRASVLHGGSGGGDRRRSSAARTSSAFTVTEDQARDLVFGCVPQRVRSRSGGHIVSPAPSRRGSQVPSLVFSDVDSKGSGLEELEEESEGECEVQGEWDVKEEQMKRWGRIFEPREVVVAPSRVVAGKAAVVRI